jgi:S1-C subfamily serine protease
MDVTRPMKFRFLRDDLAGIDLSTELGADGVGFTYNIVPEVGDVVLKINDKDIEKGADLTRTVSEIKPGTRVRLLVWHKGVTRELNVPVVEIDSPRKS